jgi:glycosyltransferase involved in cell wall biosynthesis
MKVLYVIDGLGTGGAERSLAETLPELPRLGILPILVCLHRRPEGVQEEVIGHFDVRFLEASRTLGRAMSLRKIIEETRPDLVHSTIFAANVVARLAAIGGPPLVSTLVNTPYVRARLADPNMRRSRLALVRLVDGWTSRHLTDHFQAITGAVADHAVERLRIRRDRITVVERGRDPGRLGTQDPERRARARLRLGIPEDAPVLVTLGRQEYQKGQRFLLEAIELLAVRWPRVILLLGGRKGEASDELVALTRHREIGSRVRMLGHREDVAEILAAADVYVFPSLWEGLGGSLIEAMAVGLPIVASDIPAVAEVLEEGQNAVLASPGSANALAGAIDGMLSDPARARAFGARSRRIFEERFTLERSVIGLVDMYNRLLARASLSPAPPPRDAALREGSHP